MPRCIAGAAPDLSPDSSLGLFLDLSAGLFLDLSAGLFLDPVRFQLLGLWPWRDHTPECGGSATLKAIILTRTPSLMAPCYGDESCAKLHLWTVRQIDPSRSLASFR